MPTIQVNSRGDELFYEDTGAPDGVTDYRTVVLVHGTVFHSAVFKRLAPLASKFQLRLVFVNRRDYPGSTPFTPDDLAIMNGSDRALQEKFLADHSLDILTFVKRFVEKNILPISEDGKRGGVALLAWSSGITWLFAALGNLAAFDPESLEKLRGYMRCAIAYEVPTFVLGNPAPGIGGMGPQHAHPDAEFVKKFSEYVSGYFSHTDLASRDRNGLSKTLSTHRLPTSTAMSEEGDLEGVTSPEVLFRSERYRAFMSLEIFRDNFQNSLFNEELAAKYLPEMRVEALWSEHSTMECVSPAWEIEAKAKSAGDEGKRVRPVRVTMIGNVNHFAHWDEPELFMDALSAVV